MYTNIHVNNEQYTNIIIAKDKKNPNVQQDAVNP